MLSVLRLQRKQKNSPNPFRIHIFLFLSYSFRIETINTFTHSRSSLENHTRFQTCAYPFSVQNGPKTLPDGAAHTYIAYLREYSRPPESLLKEIILPVLGDGSEVSAIHKRRSQKTFKNYKNDLWRAFRRLLIKNNASTFHDSWGPFKGVPWLFRMAILLWDRRFIYSTLWKVFKSSKFWKLYILHTPFSLQKRTRFRLKRTKKQYPSGSYTQDISVICLGCGVNWSLNGRPPTLPPTTPSLRRLFS